MTTKGKMKVLKRLITVCLVCSLVVSGFCMTAVKAPKEALAAAKCYEVSGDAVVKIGGYYYRVSDNGSLQRSKKKKSGYKTVISAKNVYQFLIVGSNAYYKKSNEDYTVHTFYRCKTNGKSNKKLLATKKDVSIATVYNNKIYVSSTGELCDPETYSINLKGKPKLKLEKKGLTLFNIRSGRHILGASWLPTDVSDCELCVFDTKTKKKYVVGMGGSYSATFIKSKVYFATAVYKEADSTYHVTIYKCDKTGKNKKKVKTIGTKITYVTKITETYCEGYNNNGEKVKVKY